MNPKVKLLLDALEELSASDIREVLLRLQDKFGFGGPDELGAGVPKKPFRLT